MSASAELRRLGGLDQVVTLLEAGESLIRENAALVLANCSQSDEDFAIRLVEHGEETWQLLCDLLAGALVNVALNMRLMNRRTDDGDATVQRSVARTIANCSAIDPEDLDGISVAELIFKSDGLKSCLCALNTGSEPGMHLLRGYLALCC